MPKLSTPCKRGKEGSKSKHSCLYFVNFIIRLTTFFGTCAGPSSGHKIYKEENYTVWVIKYDTKSKIQQYLFEF